MDDIVGLAAAAFIGGFIGGAIASLLMALL